jgi:hypothetical protein
MSSFKTPRDNEKYRWTHHVVRKMAFYGLTPSRVLRIIRSPDRIEEGIVDGTLAAMQTAGTKTRPWEAWAMWKAEKTKKIIITAWRYPGVSPIRERAPVPADIIAELRSDGIL